MQILENIKWDAILSPTFVSGVSFSISGDSDLAANINRCLIAVKDVTNTIKKVGYIKSATASSGTVTATVIINVALAATDSAYFICREKVDKYKEIIYIAGTLAADTGHAQGNGLFDRKMDEYLLSVDSALGTAAGEPGAECIWNVYKGTTNLFTYDQDMVASKTYNDRIPDTNTISKTDDVTVRIKGVGGLVNPKDLSISLYIVPQFIFSLIS